MKKCVLDENKICNDCKNCLRCDLDSEKICDNCMKCIEGDNYNSYVMKNVKIMTQKEYDKLGDN